MNKITKSLLATALMAALPLSGAMACTINAWTGNPSASAPDAAGPAQGVARYSGVCALAADAGEFVTDNYPVAEGTYRARFYVLTSAVTSTAKIFSATSEDNGGGSEVLRVDLGSGGTSLTFFQNGAQVGSPITGLTAGKWYSVELFYKTGAGNGSFSATVAGNVSFTGNIPATTITASGTIGSARLGFLTGTGPAMRFDAFESTRSADTAIGRLCRGDANGATPATINVSDRTTVNNEILGTSLGAGQPDCNEDGVINVSDRTCVNNLILAGTGCN
jgi:hypothetical protein